jgi:hypothetical protein
MKTKINILTKAAILFLLLSGSGIKPVFSSTGSANTSPVTKNGSSIEYSLLAPVTPSEASFEGIDSPSVDFRSLMPVTPGEAAFDEDNDFVTDLFSFLAPVTPKEAGFDEKE